MTGEERREQTIRLAGAEIEVRRRIVANMTWQDLLETDADFERWAHEGQLPPQAEGWRTWLMMAGRGFGKTRAGAEWIEKIARSRPGVRIALVGATMDEARRVMAEGVSGVLSVAKRNRSRIRWEPAIGRIRWPNESEAQLFSGDNPEGLRGPEHDFAWCAAHTRCHRRGGSRGAAARRAACDPGKRPMLSRWRQSRRRLVGLLRPRCGVQRGRLAVCRAGGRHVAAGEEHRNLCHLGSGRMGSRYITRFQSHP